MKRTLVSVFLGLVSLAMLALILVSLLTTTDSTVEIKGKIAFFTRGAAFDDEIAELFHILEQLMFDAKADNLTLSDLMIRSVMPFVFESTGYPDLDKRTIHANKRFFITGPPLSRAERDLHYASIVAFSGFSRGYEVDGKIALLREFIDLTITAGLIFDASRGRTQETIIFTSTASPTSYRENFVISFHDEIYRRFLYLLSDFTGIPMEMIDVRILPGPAETL